MLFALIARLSIFLPVGFILSPILTKVLPKKTGLIPEHAAVIFFSFIVSNSAFSKSNFNALICFGVVPQQPPTIEAFALISSIISLEKSCGEKSKTVLSPKSVGIPALGFAIIGVEEIFSILFTISTSPLGPLEQLPPSASTPSPSKVIASDSGVVPEKVLKLSSKLILAKMGKLLFSFAAKIAAFSSSKSVNVSIYIKSTLEVSKKLICSAKRSYASSNFIVPYGSRSCPIGPISYATKPLPNSSTASLAASVAFLITSFSSSLEPSFFLLILNVFVTITSAPASKYSKCTFLIKSLLLTLISGGNWL